MVDKLNINNLTWLRYWKNRILIISYNLLKIDVTDDMWLKAITVALLPILLIQGRKVKKNTPRLSEPNGPRVGKIGKGKLLRILILGDSAAAGVGVAQQEDALSGCILSALYQDYEIDWKLHAKTGNTTTNVISMVDDLSMQYYDVIVLSAGVNDVTKLMSASSWLKKQEQLYNKIQEKFKPKLVIAAGVPPMDKFPALPNPLAWLFGQYSKNMNKKLAQLSAEKLNLQWIEYNIEQYQHLNLEMAEDGFHPSKEIYQIWAKEIADIIRRNF